MNDFLLGIFIFMLTLLVVRLNQQRQHIARLKNDLYYAQKHAARDETKGVVLDSVLKQALITLLEDGLLILDENGIILSANEPAIALFKRPMVNQTLMVATRHFELDALVQMALRHPHEIQEKYLVISEQNIQGRVLYVGKLILVILHDVTVMQQLSRARREMIANITHELNTPITTVGLLADTLLGGAADKPDVRDKMLQNIKFEAETLTQLVQEMRDLSLIESRQMPIKMVGTDLRDIIQKSVYPLNPIAERKKQTISIEVPHGILVLADENQLPRVIKNIVHNAIKFTPETGTIQISCHQDPDEVTVQISDNGPGIPQLALNRIFERFFQADPARKQGTGLGLAIARHIILGHGGNISAHNNPLKGATFTFTLPRADGDFQNGVNAAD